MKVLATYNIKGGVGKTSAAVNLAALSAKDGLRTLLWDLDPQGSATFLLRVKPKVRGGGRRLVGGQGKVEELLRGTDIDGLDLLPADFSYRHMDLALDGAKESNRRLSGVLEPLADDYDLVVLDCPPSISLVSENVFHAAEALLTPLVPTTLTLQSFEQLVRFVAKQARPPQIVAFFSAVDRRKRLHRDIVASLPASQPAIVTAAIPSSSEVEHMGVHRAPVTVFAPSCRAARAYVELWGETKTRVGIG